MNKSLKRLSTFSHFPLSLSSATTSNYSLRIVCLLCSKLNIGSGLNVTATVSLSVSQLHTPLRNVQLQGNQKVSVHLMITVQQTLVLRD
jgi:hypothetical protein